MTEAAPEPYRALLVLEYAFTDGPASIDVLRNYILSRVAYDEEPPPDSVRLVVGQVADDILAKIIEVSVDDQPDSETQ